VASRSKPYDRVAVGTNVSYVIEAVRAEDDSPWYANAHGAFLFPQMLMDQNQKRQMGEESWSPGFVDYLFLAFNTSTAFSPSDVPVLSRWAKAMMIVESIISLATVVVAARAMNIL
jgi:uncharacterized membrane protein